MDLFGSETRVIHNQLSTEPIGRHVFGQRFFYLSLIDPQKYESKLLYSLCKTQHKIVASKKVAIAIKSKYNRNVK